MTQPQVKLTHEAGTHDPLSEYLWGCWESRPYSVQSSILFWVQSSLIQQMRFTQSNIINQSWQVSAKFPDQLHLRNHKFTPKKLLSLMYLWYTDIILSMIPFFLFSIFATYHIIKIFLVHHSGLLLLHYAFVRRNLFDLIPVICSKTWCLIRHKNLSLSTLSLPVLSAAPPSLKISRVLMGDFFLTGALLVLVSVPSFDHME